MVGARLQGHVEGGTAGGLPCLPERQNLRALGARPAVPSRAEDPVSGDDHCPHGGVRARASEPLAGQTEGRGHVDLVRSAA